MVSGSHTYGYVLVLVAQSMLSAALSSHTETAGLCKGRLLQNERYRNTRHLPEQVLL